MPNALNKGAGSEASLPVTLRVRRRAPKLIFPQVSVKNRFSDGFVLFRRGFRLCGGEKHTLLCGIASHEPQYQSTKIAAGKGWKPSMDQAQWAQTEIALLPTEQIALRPSVQQKSLSHMPLETLAASMAREGLREPILVRAAAQGYMIVEGNRRLMACRMLGWREIPARVQPKDVSDMTSAGEIFAALRARPMGYLDRAEAANRLTADFGVPRAAIAQQTGDSAAHVLSLQRIATLDDRTRDILRQERLPERVAEALTRVVDAESRQRIALRTAKERLDIREVELFVEAANRRLPGAKHSGKVVSAVRDARPYLNALREVVAQMNEAGLPVRFDEAQEDGGMTLTIRCRTRRRRSQP